MNTAELRRGNYLMGTKPVMVESILSDSMVGINSGDPYTVTGSNPCLSAISLTTEVLTEWCGFSRHPVLENTFSNGVIGVFFSKGTIYAGTLTVRHLHFFQNWYYFNTAKELEINIPK